MIDGAIVRSRCAEGIGLRFSSLLRSEERRISRLLALRLPDLAISQDAEKVRQRRSRIA